MIRKHINNKTSNEYGFTLIELLVVILIIGVLASIAIPAFLNQRQRANDAAVLSDVKNVVMAIESEQIAQPHEKVAQNGARNTERIRVGVGTLSATNGTTVELSPGVGIKVLTWDTGTYTVYGWHENGKNYTQDVRGYRLNYSQRDSGFEIVFETKN